MEKVISWLLDQNPVVQYNTRIHLLDEPVYSDDCQLSYAAMLNYHPVKMLVAEMGSWPGSILKRHNDAKLLYHKLAFLTDIGMGSEDPCIRTVLNKIMQNTAPEGPFQITGNIPRAFGGSGLDEELWMLCDAPILTYILIRMNHGSDVRVQKSLNYLLALAQNFGWPCKATSAIGNKFKGPGKRTDPCPYGNLLMLKLIAAVPHLHQSREALAGIEMLLQFWQNRKQKKYFLFGMGTDFNKLKAPFIWFDILHVAEVLSHFKAVHDDPRFMEIIRRVKSGMDNDSLYKADSVYMVWKDWDFGQKRVPSAWITFIVYRLLKRINKL